jgi:hypothetical protein
LASSHCDGALPPSGGVVLVTGATGYVGGRVRRALESDGRRPLRCMARKPEYLRASVAPGTQVVAGDVLDPASLGPALEGVHTAYYLIHSMGSGHEYEQSDREGARAFAAAARAAGVARIVYLGGLSPASSTSAGWDTATGSPTISRADRKSAAFSASREFLPSSSAPRSSSAPAVSRSSWCARWSRSCR